MLLHFPWSPVIKLINTVPIKRRCWHLSRSKENIDWTGNCSILHCLVFCSDLGVETRERWVVIHCHYRWGRCIITSLTQKCKGLNLPYLTAGSDVKNVLDLRRNGKGLAIMAWKWIRISLKSRMVSWYKNEIVRAGVSNCMHQCLNFLVLNVHIPASLGLRGKPFYRNRSFF